MEKVSFKWWPWCTSAAGIPLLAGLAGGLAGASKGELKDDLAIVVALSCWGAGNALLVGMAIGGVGRALLAMVAGGVVGMLVTATCDGFQLALVAHLVLWLTIGVALPLKWSAEGLLTAMGACVGAAMRQLAVTLVGGALLFWMDIAGAFPDPVSNRIVSVLAGIFLACLGNVLALRYLFMHTFRTGQGGRGGVAWEMDQAQLSSMV